MFKMNDLIDLIKADNNAYVEISPTFIYVPIKQIHGNGFKNGITSGIYINLDKVNGVWGCIFQALVHYIDPDNAKYNKSNVAILLNAACNILKRDYEYFDNDNTVKVKWDVYLENSLNDGSNYGSVNATFMVYASAQSIFELIQSLDDFPEFELEEITLQ